MTRPMALGTYLLALACAAAPAGGQTFLDCNPAEPRSALKLDGNGQFVRVPHNLSLPVETFTTAAWVRTDAGQVDDFGTIVSRGKNETTGDGSWSFSVHASGLVSLEIVDDLDQSAAYFTSNAVGDGKWHHIAATRDHLSKTVTLYVDGSIDSVHADTKTPSPFGAQYLQIGAAWAEVGGSGSFASIRFFKGTIDEVALWNKPLSPEEVFARYSSGVDGADPGLVAYWPFDEGSGQAILDVSTLGNHGFLGASMSPATDDPQWYLLPQCPLGAIGSRLSLAVGGTQQFVIDPGPAYGLMLYFVAGSSAGTSPGFTFAGLPVPLNPGSFFFYTINHPNEPPYKKTLGYLTSAGTATAGLTVMPGTSSALAGLELHHAYLVWDVLGGSGAAFVSNPVPMKLVP